MIKKGYVPVRVYMNVHDLYWDGIIDKKDFDMFKLAKHNGAYKFTPFSMAQERIMYLNPKRVLFMLELSEEEYKHKIK